MLLCICFPIFLYTDRKLLRNIVRHIVSTFIYYYPSATTMTAKRKETDVSLYQIIVNLYSKRKSLWEIGSIVVRAYSIIPKVVNKFKYEGMLKEQEISREKENSFKVR